MWITIGIVILLLVIYMYNFWGGSLSNESGDWGSFGAYFGSITGLLAFVGVLYSLEQSNKAHIENSERSTFFQLLDLHNTKVLNTEYESQKGVAAFRRMNEASILILHKVNLFEYISEKNFETADFEEYKSEARLAITIYDKYFKQFLVFEELDKTVFNEMKNRIKEYKYQFDDKKFNELVIYSVNKLNHLTKDIINHHLKKVSDAFNTDYGHITGHYFRNMFYLMDTVSKFSDTKNYKEIFRAQLSRYELTLILFNATSSNSSIRQIELIQEFELLKDIYPEDIFIFKELLSKKEGKTQQEKMLSLTNELLELSKKQFDTNQTVTE